MKKFNLNLMPFLAIALILISSSAQAATYYVREDGGTPTQCDGTHDAARSGAVDSGDPGSTPDCAFNHPYHLIRHGIDDTGTYSGTNVIVGGDTVILGAPDGAGGSLDQFLMGYDATNIPSGCYRDAAYGCWLDTIPAGPSASNPTRILGRGYDTGCTGNKVQLWGTERVRSILRLGGRVELQCVDITDHSACMLDGVAESPVDGFPIACEQQIIPFGTHGQDGIWISGSDNIIKNVDVHGMPRYGMTTMGDFGNNRIENSKFVNNGYGGFSTGPSDEGTGKLSLINNTMDGNGCGERYPLQSSTLNSSSNWHHCTSQGQNGAASPDGFAFGNESSSATAGSYDFIGGSYSHNTGDGIDTLHGEGNGTILISGILAEGNGGNAIKPNALFAFVENNKLIGNCGFFNGQSFTSVKDTTGSSFPFSDCRARGHTISIPVTNNSEAYIYNNTILSNGEGVILSNDHLGAGCNGSTKIIAENNLIWGGWFFLDDSGIFSSGGDEVPYLYYASGDAEGNGGGTCGGSNVPLTRSHNLVYQTSSSTTNCGGTNDICASDPLFSGTIKQGHGSVGSYYQGTDYAAQLTLSSSSPARNAADETITCDGDCSIDYNGFSRGASWDIGALEYGSSSTTLCGNGTIDSGEDCDGVNLNAKTCITQGFDSGSISCNSDCTFNTSSCVTNCGNGTIQSPEECDGANLNSKTCATEGFTGGGAITCNSNCTVNTSACSNIFCGDEIVEGSEECDGADLNSHSCISEGFDAGDLNCSPSCTLDTAACITVTCGNGTIGSGEQCDGSNLSGQTCITQGFAGGTLDCDGSCQFDTSGCLSSVCGNGTIETSEQCDGSALNSQTCTTLGFNSGTLSCNNCSFNTSGCAYNPNTGVKMIIGGKVAAGGVGSIQ